jgi:predicted Rossmann-fold nucleotide-binding protein
MSIYAGIGSRRVTTEERALCKLVGAVLARRGWVLHTGACLGADQAYAEGALEFSGSVHLYLPWTSYEKEWVAQYGPRCAHICTAKQHPAFAEAVLSVARYHPHPDKLTNGGQLLHARNYLILEDCNLCVALPKGQGGTRQGMRIASHLRIPTVNLDGVLAKDVATVLNPFTRSLWR